jgi:hypothetical protein
MLSYKPTGKRSIGRPRKRWISQILGATGKSPMHEVEEVTTLIKALLNIHTHDCFLKKFI